MRYLLIVLCTLALIGCKGNQEKWYLQHPKALKEALEACPGKYPRGIDCDKLAMLKRFNDELAYSLQKNPQAFGQRIIQMQIDKARIKNDLAKRQGQQDARTLQEKLERLNRELEAHRFTVQILESPEG